MGEDKNLEAAIAAADLPGAVALITDAKDVRYARAFGHADAVAGTPMEVDTVCQIASMTKAIVGVAAMQLVEQGRLSLDEPIAKVLPELAAPQLLTGFDDAGQPQLRPATKPITLRHLLTHTSGFSYHFVRPETLQYFMATGMPAPGSKAGISMPLVFEPGEAWEYSVGIDWAGLAVEAVTGQTLGKYLDEYVTGPLGMTQTAFRPEPPADAAKVHARLPDGGFATVPAWLGGGEFEMGGGGLSSTAPDYARFIRMVLNDGELDGARILKADTIADMSRNHVGDIRAGRMTSALPELAPPFDTFPDQHTGWGLSWLINPEPGPDGRPAGSLAWAGIFNSYYWIDRAGGLGGVFISQLSPFGDKGALSGFGALERMAYA